MAQLLGLSAEQVDGIRPLFPKERGGKRVNDRRVLSGHHPCHSEGSVLGGCPCCRWPPQNPLQPFAAEPEVLMLDATNIKAHPTASSLNKGTKGV